MALAQHDDHNARHGTLVTNVHLSLKFVNLKFTLAAKRHHKATHISLCKVFVMIAVNNVQSVAWFAIDLVVSLNGELLSLAELFHLDLEWSNHILHLIHLDEAFDLIDSGKAAHFPVVGLLHVEARRLSGPNVNEVALEMTAAGHGRLVDDHDRDRVFVICLREVVQQLLTDEILEQRYK